MDIRLLDAQDIALLLAVEDGVFDNRIDSEQAQAFLDSKLHEIAVALDEGAIVAFASGCILLHPDKQPSMFINEVSTRESHRRKGYAKAVSRALIERARARGCNGIWLGTEPENIPARSLYRKLGGEECSIVGYGWDGAFGDPN